MIYLVRHCQAEGQPPEAKLTDLGEQQAEVLADFFSDKKIDYIVSSPFTRAKHTVAPLSKKLGVDVTVDDRLAERVVSTNDLPDILDKLKATYEDDELKYEGGESSREATTRVVEVMKDLEDSEYENIVAVTHGNLLSLLLRTYDPSFGFNEWKQLSNPDVYVIDGQKVQRLWEGKED
ncbi:histidine phosphatase family protein [Bacillus shivajii]|uniref:histidine phosphatase family protein n=1 Tax=Bacillus shivajii TaxID=1983719 RepID=UPI001CFAE8F9|nr:histidine phosphatase family protein [Bacillus shivajii]UCZ52117.1 histidine phosphatase family protein [Bacillus shivajii]